MILFGILSIGIIYYFIGNYIVYIPISLLYYNYYKNTKLIKLDDYIEDQNTSSVNKLFCKGIKKFYEKTDFKINLYDKFINCNYENIFFIYILKIDNFILIIINDFLLFILYYLKQLMKYIISNQVSILTNNKPVNVESKKKNILELMAKKYS